jgi:hypothetical protein
MQPIVFMNAQYFCFRAVGLSTLYVESFTGANIFEIKNYLHYIDPRTCDEAVLYQAGT